MEQIAVHLREVTHCTIKDLATEHGVSTRTIARDLELMRDRGMQIDTDRGRGGGVRLERNWGVGRINLDYAEALDLLISIAVADRMRSPIFLANLGSVRRQLVASFSPEKRSKVHRLKARILVGDTASPYVQKGVGPPAKRVVQALHRAFVDLETLQIRYRREDQAISERVIEPHYLMLNYPVWYVVAMDHLRQAPRTFRCDRIEAAEATGTLFRLLPKKRFASPLIEAALLE